MDLKKKYQNQGEFTYPHLGRLIAEKMAEHNVSKAELARRLGVGPSTVHSYTKLQSVQFGILWKIGIAINHNFFTDLMPFLPKYMSGSIQNANSQEVESLKQEVEIYKKLVIESMQSANQKQ